MLLFLVKYAYFRKRNRILSRIVDAMVVIGFPLVLGSLLNELSPSALVWILITLVSSVPVFWFLAKTDKLYSQLPD